VGGETLERIAFQQIEQALASGGAVSALDLLARKFIAEKQYPQLFETRLMEKRLELGLPLIQIGAIEDLPEPARASYEEEVRRAARETGALFLADGDIARAWPYFRAIGERQTIAAALEAAPAALDKTAPSGPAPSRPDVDALIDIALGERVHPRKGLELVIGRHGICRAITYFEQFPDLEDRQACLTLLVETLQAELVANLKNAIARREGRPPTTNSIAELIAGRDWLFGEFDTYTDTSHVINVVRFAVDLQDAGTIRLALELCAYGERLSPQFRMRGEPPFDDIYCDHAVYLRALLNQDVDAAVEHFKNKIAASGFTEGEFDPRVAVQCAQVLVNFLARLGRYAEAVQVWLEHLSHVPAGRLACPTLFQLCQLAGDSRRWMELARQRGDLLSFVAGAIQVNG
jgi:hypothetical protein